MTAERVRRAFESYLRRWPGERRVVERFTALISAWPRCLERSYMPGHITASGWVVHAPSAVVLLTHHRKLDRWLQLGGHADGQRNVVGVARREVEEESGITRFSLWNDREHDLREDDATIPTPCDIDIHEIPSHKGVPAHLHYDVRFAFLVAERETPVVSDESHDVAWIALDRLEEYTDEESMLRMRRKWRAAVPSKGARSPA